MTPYSVKVIPLSSGERFPMLIDNKTGMPDYWSTVFSITQHRSKGNEYNTIALVLRQIIILKLFLKKHYSTEINITKRLKEGKLLTLPEIESLCDICTVKLEKLNKEYNKKQKTEHSLKITSLEKFRLNNTQNNIDTVEPSTSGNRIRTIKEFLVWLANVHLAKLPEDSPTFSALKEARDFLKSTMASRIPKYINGSNINSPMGLSEEAIKKLFAVIPRNSPENPWKNEFTKVRNELLILWLYQFGLRRGELLSIKISDIDFRSEKVTVERRSIDKSDPRHNKPNVKTRGRILPIPIKILELTQDYIINHRTHLPRAKEHEFLFVASKTGMPMSLDTVNKVFSKLLKIFPSILGQFTPHTLRHTWNDNFSKQMDLQNISEEREKKIRSYLMGWSETSESASTYTRRHIQNKSNEVILQMGNKLIENFNTDDGKNR